MRKKGSKIYLTNEEQQIISTCISRERHEYIARNHLERASMCENIIHKLFK